MGPNAMILVFWMLNFKPAFSLSSFIFISRLFSFSSLYAIRVVSSAYLRLLIFLPATLITTCASSSPAFLMMYSEYKLNKQGDNIQPWCTPFPIYNQSVVPFARHGNQSTERLRNETRFMKLISDRCRIWKHVAWLQSLGPHFWPQSTVCKSKFPLAAR